MKKSIRRCDRCGEEMKTDRSGCYVEEVAEIVNPKDPHGKHLIVHVNGCMTDKDELA